jgi:2-dehydropantoate 2-reductase
VLARGGRLSDLQKNGLRYNEKGTTKSVPVKVIEALQDDDIYDFIFVAVRCDQAEAALTGLQSNKSKNIVTLTNTVGYDAWTPIVGERLIPGFPGAGGDLKDGVLFGQFGRRSTFGEIGGRKTERIKALACVFDKANLPYEICSDIHAFHVSHAAMVAPLHHFCTEDGMVDAKTARSSRLLRSMVLETKQNIRSVEQAGIPNPDSMARAAGKLPTWAGVLLFRVTLSTRFGRDVMLGDHALSAMPEAARLDEDLRKIRPLQRD